MSISINIPEDLYQEAVAIAEVHNVPVDEVFASALGGTTSVLAKVA